ncbi:Endonuclease/exonuclease/phosphatase [Gloeophyllum trabeum ATCC 11539]|uniref:Endonuclease/exonuclease/phosphatase n=1 Tax=Gloeophyllum trabeum (strain ATCC 11539 / FP-39264 / Madison 617) TaxID=670483 RepID=S7QMU2_GLOTA|nr:Endonuclease/exonuclease/phosphatase [Gloeophyllum trabeum ATCC 11539]EPQ60717.1 Endonuclease/exonuclease/phosphatase [Gloeophyllum trabeum ATCC 11539]
MSQKGGYQLTPEQLALQEERRRKKLNAQSQTPKPPLINEEKGHVLPREWLKLPESGTNPIAQRIKIMTWNMLAQCLVRRELFPNSDCLKAAQREHMLYYEIASHTADILCLQEVDRLEKLLPVLEALDYAYTYAAGPRKLHGCLIAYKKDKYEKVAEKVIEYDQEDVRKDGEERARRGSSFRTKNIANLVALEGLESDCAGIIVATTHLFWHPRYTYERARQAGILRREVIRFQQDEGHIEWPCIVAGDFNAPPDDATYSLLVGDPVLPSQEERLSFSRVVHATIDPTVPADAAKTSAEEEDEGAVQPNEDGEEETDPDRIITNARAAGPEDGLLTTAELTELYSTHDSRHLKSLYEEGLKSAKSIASTQGSAQDIRTFGDRFAPREPDWSTRHGLYEPEWTSYTFYWHATLDYIFVIDPPSRVSAVSGLLKPFRTEELIPGIPRKGISGSDHVALVAEVTWTGQP